MARAWDEPGATSRDLVSERDGRYLATFARGPYQGIAEDHFVEFELGARRRAGTRRRGSWRTGGSIRPTAASTWRSGRARHVPPRGLSLEALDATGRWVVVAPDLGFPAGKNKTILIDLVACAAGVARRGVCACGRISRSTGTRSRLPRLPSDAACDDRGCSAARRGPALPRVLATRTTSAAISPRCRSTTRSPTWRQRWRDLVGLLHALRRRARAPRACGRPLRDHERRRRTAAVVSGAAAAGRRAGRATSCSIGDGWVKDGDYNTSFSKTVLPLPSHDRPDYGAGTASLDARRRSGLPAPSARTGRRSTPGSSRRAISCGLDAEVGAMTRDSTSAARRCGLLWTALFVASLGAVVVLNRAAVGQRWQAADADGAIPRYGFRLEESARRAGVDVRASGPDVRRAARRTSCRRSRRWGPRSPWRISIATAGRTSTSPTAAKAA